jgi:hypothetical protein
MVIISCPAAACRVRPTTLRMLLELRTCSVKATIKEFIEAIYSRLHNGGIGTGSKVILVGLLDSCYRTPRPDSQLTRPDSID